ncbi:thymidine kinase 2, mitochondrial-like isoform X2 [Pollicipes pollicipes]|nr:thymidine kinase 2, mitochondrial-like isoform X2 [Pollicipes pollicipes]
MSPSGDTRITICVEGNLASGKTTLLGHIRSRSGVEVIEEPVGTWRNVANANLYALLVEDRDRWGFMFQSYAQLTMADIHARPSSAAVKVMERSIYSGRHVFVENLYRTGRMTDVEYTVLDQWYSWLTTCLDINPQLIVYLRSSPEVVFERMRQRCRDEESTMSLSHVRDIHALHEEWLLGATRHTPSCPVLVLDADKDTAQVRRELDSKIGTYLHDSE